MRKKIILVWSSLLLLSIVSFSQTPAVDSAASELKKQQKIAELTKNITERNEKLVLLEQKLIAKTADRERAAQKANESSEANRQAATRLSDDSQDKKKAKRAENLSDDARRDAKRARIAGDNVEEVEKEIKSLRKKIGDDEASLEKINPVKPVKE